MMFFIRVLLGWLVGVGLAIALILLLRQVGISADWPALVFVGIGFVFAEVGMIVGMLTDPDVI